LSAAERFTRPPWIPEWITNEVAAILSQLPDPSKWQGVTFEPQPDGAPWRMTVELKRGYPITIDIPGGGGPGSGAKEVLDLVADIQSGRDTKNKKAAAIFSEVERAYTKGIS
jgi:hypothetical protein